MASSVFNNSSLFFIIVFSVILLPVLSKINSDLIFVQSEKEDVDKIDVVEERSPALKLGNDGPEGPPHTVNIREPRSLGRGNYGLPGLPGLDDHLPDPGSFDSNGGRPGLLSSTVMAMHCRICQKRRNRVCIRRYCNYNS